MLKTSSTESVEPRKGIVGVGGGSKVRRDRGGLDGSGMDDVEVDGSEVGDNEIGKKGRNLSKSKKTESGFLTSRARMAFTKLRQAFIKAPILYHFDSKCHIWVETDMSSYAIDWVLSELTLDDLDQ